MNTHRRLRIATIFVLFTAYVLAGFQAAFSAHREAVAQRTARVAVAHRSLFPSSIFGNSGLAPGRQPMTRFTLNPHPVIAHDTPVAVPSITGGVQTYDVFAAPNSFDPPAGSDGVTPLARSAVNLYPVWTKDEKYLLFSSNRDADGTATTHPGRFHIWAVSSQGNTAPVQITDSSTKSTDTDGVLHGELYPAIDSSGTQLAFVSDALSKNPDSHHLYVIPSFSATPSAPTVIETSATVESLTIRPDGADPGFNDVARPTWGTSNQLAFSGRDDTAAGITGGTTFPNSYVGHYHIWFLYVNSLGYNSQATTNNYPAKLTDGPADDNNPAWSGDGNFISFDSDAAAINQTGSAIAPGQSPILTTTPTGTSHQIYLITSSAVIPSALSSTGGRVTSDSGDDVTPAWSSSKSNPYTNSTGNLEYLAFSRSSSATTPHDIYYISALSTTSGAGGSTSVAVTPESTTNAAVHVVTETNGASPGGSYDDLYPQWSGFSSTYSISYESNRSVTYFDITKSGPTSDGEPVETAISLPQGDTKHSIGAKYVGVLVSQVLNLDPPTLIPFNDNEVIHVNQGSSVVIPSTSNASGSAIRQLQTGTKYTFTVRLSDRESGVDNNNVYLQIKDPDSKYQDSQSLEHKVYAQDPNAPAYKNQGGDGSADGFLFNGPGGNHGWNIDTVGGVTAPITCFGVVGGEVSAAKGTIQVGHDGGGTNTTGGTTAIPGGDPAKFSAFGPEYEAQVVNPTVLNPSTNAGDYSVPFYLAGFDDQTPLTGATDTARPTSGANAQWLPLTVNKDSSGNVITDGNGGVLYSGTWTTPNSPSDFYLDVIAYDNAVNPVQAITGSTVFTGKNWRIYDNVWGVSSASVDPSKGILLVSDYALGQKWSATAFGGVLNRPENILPVYYGAESYVSDIDTNMLPTAAYLHYGGFVYIAPITETAETWPIVYTGEDFPSMHCQADNTLGARSYTDFNGVQDGTTTVDGNEYDQSNQYTIWRTLCRGALNYNTLKAWLPVATPEPAVSDGTVTATATSVPSATKCVVWISPYCGTMFTALNNPGTLADPQEQTALTQFVNNGGRLAVSGAGVAANEPTFAKTVLHGTYVSTAPTDTNSRFLTTAATKLLTTTDIASLFLSNDIVDAQGINATQWRADGSLDQDGPVVLRFGNNFTGSFQDILGAPDVITPADTSTKAEINSNAGTGTSAGMVYYEAPSTSTAPVPGTRTVFSSFGLEALSNDYYIHTDGTGTYAFHIESRNNRTMVMHGIVNYLRTGDIAGRILDQTNPSVGISGATVYAQPTSGGTLGVRNVYSATTDSTGTYDIAGVPPGSYNVIAYRTGYNRVVSTAPFIIEGDVTTKVTLKMLALNPATISGVVTDASTSKPISGAQVSWQSADPNVAAVQVSTDANGAYSAQVSSTTAGIKYTGTATATGYSSATTSLTVVAGTTYSNENFSLTPQTTTGGGNGILIGLVQTVTSGVATPLGGVTVTVTDSTGATVATATTASTTTSPASPSGDGKPINYSVAVAPGTYKVSFSKNGLATKTITNVLIVKNTVTREDYPFPLHTFTAGLQFFSLPYDYTGTSWNTLFGAVGTSRSHVALWQQTLGQYVLDPTSPADAPRLGYGYWIRLASAIDLTQAGTTPTTGTISVPLTAGWNMIGVPSTTNVNVTSLKFVNPLDVSNPLTWTQATGIQYNLVSSSLYSYDPTAGQYVAVTSANQLVPYTGYWIKANDNATLLIPTSGP